MQDAIPEAVTSESTVARQGRRGWTRAAAFTTAGLLAGAAVAGTISANAAGNASSSSPGSSSATAPSSPEGGNRDESQPQRSDEQLLTGTVKEKVQAAALAKYPGATVLRVETDSDGVYEAHLVTTGGARVTVEVGKDFAVTGTESGHGGGGHPGAGPSSDAASTATT